MNSDQIKSVAQAVRSLSIDGVEKAKSGHPGLPLGAADFASVLWSQFLRFNPEDPNWPGRDRFILSAGHGSMLIYSLLHLFGYNLPLDELKNFRQWESKTPGHPEFEWTPGVETTTGPLGQGFANGVGMALSAKMLSARYSNELFNYNVYAIVSDGDLMEGVAAEAASLAGHLKLDNLIYLYDDNKISLADPTEVCFTESVAKRFEGYGWYVQEIDGHDIAQISQAIESAKAEAGRPSIICCRTTIGFGSPNKAGSADVHGSPLGADEAKLTKEKLGLPADKEFYISDAAKAATAEALKAKKDDYAGWQQRFKSWSQSNKELADQLSHQLERRLPANLKEILLQAFNEPKKDATRNLSGKAINVIAKHVPYFIGGSADLEPSTKTLIKDADDIQAGKFSGKNIRFGVREHAMGAAVNGLAYGRDWIPYSATFLVFADYMRPTVRLAALSHLQSLFIFTHDSFWVGEDGPTHEPIEQIESLRIIPNLNVYRPADGIEVAMCYLSALEHKKNPSALLFTRQNLPPLERTSGARPEDVLKGAYILSGEKNSSLVLVATGSEVALAAEAARILESKGRPCRVVSMPCKEVFLKQEIAYRESVLPAAAVKVSLEAGITNGWKAITGTEGLSIGIDHFGASAPGEILSEKFGFSAETVATKILAHLEEK